MTRIVSVGLVVSVCLMLLPNGAAAQGTSAASIVGTVKDASGAVLPGVTIEAASPALIEKVRTTISDEKGEYRIIELRQGTYSVTFTLTGFSTFKREGLELTSNFTATINVDLKVGGIEETVTVSGETPLVDTTNIVRQATLSKTLLDTVPTGRMIYGFVALMPAAIAPSNQQDVGGGLGDSTMRITVHGAKGQEIRLMQDGLSYGFNLDNTGREFFVNPIAAQEVVIDTGGGGSAEYTSGGAITNTISKDGGNKFSGTLFAAGSKEGLVSDNLTSELKAQGLTSVNKSLNIYDVNGVIGGPIIVDKLWFSSAHRRAGHRDLVANLYKDANLNARVFGAPAAVWKYAPDFNQPVTPVEDNQAHGIRLTYQATSKDKINFSFDHQWNRNQNNIPILNTGTLAWEADAVGGQYRCGKDNLTLATWTRPATNKLLFEAGANYLSHHGGVFPDACNISPDRILIRDTALGFTYNGVGVIASQDDQTSTNQRFSMSYVTGSHNLKTGVQALEHVQNTMSDRGSIPFTYTFNNGVPTQLTEFASPTRSVNGNKLNLGLFVQDQWRIARLTVNAGIRYEYLNQYADPVSRPAGLINDAASYPGADCIPCWHNINPRIGVAYDLFGTGKTALKFSYGSYSNGSTIAGTFAPTSAVVNSTTRAWTDSNGNFYPDCDLRNPLINLECGPMANSSFGQLQIRTTADPNWITGWNKRGWNRQLSASVDQQLMPGVAASVGYFRTWYGNFTATDNTLVTPTDYDPYCITAPTDSRLPANVSGQQICGFSDIKPALFGQVDSLITLASNYGSYTEYYNGVDVTFQARLPHGAQLGGGLNVGNSVSLSAGGAGSVSDKFNKCFVVDSPQDLYHCESANPYQTRIKLNGSYPLPGGFQVAAVFQNLPGASYAGASASASGGGAIGPFGGSLLTVTTAQIAQTLGRNLSGGTRTVTIDLLPPYSSFLDARVTQIDLRASKIFRMQRMRFQGNLDLYNAANASTVLLVNQTFGSNWLQPTQIMPGRLLKISLQLDF